MKKLEGKRVIVTQPRDFMGPALARQFQHEGAEVTCLASNFRSHGSARDAINSVGHVDILVANLMQRNRRNPVTAINDEEWMEVFNVMVHPLHELVRAVLPQMVSRRRGKIVVIGSANGLRGSSPRSAYSAARGAQLAYVKSVGVEVASHGVNVNAIAQNWVENPTSYSAEVQAAPDFADRLKEVPAGRLAKDWESAALAVYLSSRESDFLFGQIFPFSGGWTV